MLMLCVLLLCSTHRLVFVLTAGVVMFAGAGPGVVLSRRSGADGTSPVDCTICCTYRAACGAACSWCYWVQKYQGDSRLQQLVRGAQAEQHGAAVRDHFEASQYVSHALGVYVLLLVVLLSASSGLAEQKVALVLAAVIRPILTEVCIETYPAWLRFVQTQRMRNGPLLLLPLKYLGDCS